ncbi:MAG: EscU/YscU/HrcU family type III secretion system export apparatus switch protein [Planctomycetota bacterium]
MPEQDREQKTEEPTEKRLNKAREDGQVPRSPDLTFAALLLTSAGLALLAGGRVKDGFLGTLNHSLENLSSASSHDSVLMALGVLERSLLVMLPFLLAFVPVAAAVSFAQFGIHFVPQKLRPRPEKLAIDFSPKKFVNGRSMIETLTSVLKLVFLLTAFYLAIWPKVPSLLITESLESVTGAANALVIRLLLYVGTTLLCIGLLDFALKKHHMHRDQKMTKDEVKQEHKDAQGNPEVKMQIRRKQREMAMLRMMNAVPSASVVITNPTHYAVALKYETGQAAPKVVAKGRDFIAQRIRELARAANVPVVENPPLARALHDSVEVGDEIPPHLYRAVAEVLAAIFRTRDRIGRTA